MTRHTAEGRVEYVTPGKHGEGDIRVEFAGGAPTHSELLAIIWGVFRAEDRYEFGRGRAMLKGLIDDVYRAPRWKDAKPVIDRARQSVERKEAA